MRSPSPAVLYDYDDASTCPQPFLQDEDSNMELASVARSSPCSSPRRKFTEDLGRLAEMAIPPPPCICAEPPSEALPFYSELSRTFGESIGNQAADLPFYSERSKPSADCAGTPLRHIPSRPSINSFGRPRLGSLEVKTEPSESHATSELRIAYALTGKSREVGNSDVSLVRAVTSATSFMLSDPEILRATWSYKALACFGAALRAKNEGFAQTVDTFVRDPLDIFDEGYHPESFVVDLINEFWSHSWHAEPTWQKVVVLLLHYNKWIGVFAAMIFALVGTILTALRLVPHFIVNTFLEEAASQPFQYSLWTLILGAPVFIIVVLLWPSHTTVFLDKICINQIDMERKKQGVRSIGSILSASQRMVVLWDPTYVSRLWCVFELAAYLKSHANRPGSTIFIRPLIWGQTIIALFCGTWFCSCVFVLLPSYSALGMMMTIFLVYLALLLLVHPLRSYSCTLSTLASQFQNFSVCEAKCFCCSCEHVDPTTGGRLRCDRRLVEACIDEWFGSISHFDNYVREHLYRNFDRRLSRAGIPYAWCMVGLVPCFWGIMDIAASHFRAGDIPGATSITIYALTFWLELMPLTLYVMFAFARRFGGRRGSVLLDVAVSLFCSLLGLGCLLAIFGATYFVRTSVKTKEALIAINVGTLVILGPLVICAYSRCSLFLWWKEVSQRCSSSEVSDLRLNRGRPVPNRSKSPLPG